MDARQRQLEIASRIVAALIESSSPEALELVEILETPAAIFDPGRRTAALENAAWRALFAARDVAGALGVEQLAAGSIHVPACALSLGGPPAYCAATLRRVGARVVVACLDITDEVTAGQVGADAAALIWSGPAGGDDDYVNARWSAYTGTRAGWQRALHPDDVACCTEARSERGSTECEARIRRADGVYRWHRVRFTHSAGRWSGTASDIHDARDERNQLLARVDAAKADAENASRLKDQFLAVVSHELRAPLTTIVLWEGLLRDDTADPALRAKALEAIRQSAISQSRVVGDLLDVSRAIAGKLHIDLRPVEISSLISHAVELIAPAALAKQIVIDHRDLLVGVEVEGDPGRLRQVIDNLLSNAVKFTEPGGRIAVTLSSRDHSIVIEVADSGRGIAADLLPHVFDPFSQSQDALRRGAGGLGLGLAIARQLVELHDGTIVASSPGTGRGATLTVTLPAVPARHRSTPPMGVSRVTLLARTRVLVIDDDHRVREALALLLERAGAVVETADSAAAARLQLASGPPDVVLCDIAMPAEDGYSFIRTLRASGTAVAAIALTAYASNADVTRALAAGFDRHVAKPIDFERLVAEIDDLVQAARITT